MKSRQRRISTSALAWVVRLAAGLLVVVLALAGSGDGQGHPGHPQKKLFAGTWWLANAGLEMDLPTDPFYYGIPHFPPPDPDLYCDGGINQGSCISKWSAPMQDAVNDWNAQPTDVNFVQTYQQATNEIALAVVDELFGNPGILGVAIHYDVDGFQCNPDACIYRYGLAAMADDPHSGVYGTNDVRRGTVIHELGHLLNLRHESVSGYPNEAPHLECGTDYTGPIPHSVMAYHCINPPAVGGLGENYVHDWDTCGVNHKYHDPEFAFSDCDSDNDGYLDQDDNCPAISNPAQANLDGDSLGDPCDPDVDGDKVTNVAEGPCGGNESNGGLRPERIDGPFAGVSDDGDPEVDEALPPGTETHDCDGDGYKGSAEAHLGTGDQDACGFSGWPADLFPGGFQVNALNIQDLASFLTPTRHLDTAPGDANFDVRWDLVPGTTFGTKHINIQDMAAIISGETGLPPMFNGTRAFGQACPWPP